MSISPIVYLKFAKDIEPEIFENVTPQLHINLINFINGKAQYKAAAVFRGAGKTTLLNKICIVSKLFFEAEPFILIVSSTEDKTLNFLNAVKNSIDRANAKGYAISRGKIWNKDKIEVIINAGDKQREKICFVSTISAGQDPRGAIINNTRPTLIIADDLESHTGAYGVGSRANRQKLRRWFYADLLPALHPSKGKFIIIGTILHEDSILNNIIHPKADDDMPRLEWEMIKFPIIHNGKSAWSSRFPLEKIEKIKGSLKAQGLDNEFYQEYMCAAIDPQKAIFKREYFRYFERVEFNFNTPISTIRVSDGVNFKEITTREAKNIILDTILVPLESCQVFTTIDLASATGADETAIVTFAVDKQNHIYILDISSGHWTPFEKSVEIIRIYQTFRPLRIGIEKAGMQNDFFYTIDVIQKHTGINLPVDGISHGGKAKNIRISNLEPYYRTGQIFHNRSQSSAGELEAQLATFDPEAESKRDDIMDATAYLLHYVARRFFDEPQYEEWDECAEREEWA